MAKKRLFEAVKRKFDYDLSELAPYVEQESKEIMQDLIFGSGLTSRVKVMEDVKGSTKVKLMNSEPILQAAAACGWTPQGGIILTDKTLTTERVKIQEEYCNEDLNGLWSQVFNARGANAQDKTPPFADLMIAYYQKQARLINQNLMINGDTTSLNPNLAHYDGYAKLWDADANLNVYTSTETTITKNNAMAIAIELFDTCDPVMQANNEEFEIWVGWETFRKIIRNDYENNNYHSQITVENGEEPSFILPTTNTRVRCYPQLNGTEKMYAVPYQYMFFGTDLEGDEEGFEFTYNENDQTLHFDVKWRSGIQYVFPQYFTRLELAAS